MKFFLCAVCVPARTAFRPLCCFDELQGQKLLSSLLLQTPSQHPSSMTTNDRPKQRWTLHKLAPLAPAGLGPDAKVKPYEGGVPHRWGSVVEWTTLVALRWRTAPAKTRL
jgi:hypothetical protein